MRDSEPHKKFVGLGVSQANSFRMDKGTCRGTCVRIYLIRSYVILYKIYYRIVAVI